MKGYIFFLILFFSSKALSQKQISIAKVEYEMTTNSNNGFDAYNAVLTFNEKISRFVFSKKAKEEELVEKEEKEHTVINLRINDTTANCIINDLNKKTIYNIIDKEIVFENNDSQRWTLGNEEKTIGKIRCKKATCNFRGRDYIAWYTDEIPVPFGPWKFNGLPGLIVEVSDATNEVFFSILKIEIPFNTEIKNISDSDKKISREDFKKRIEKELNKQKKNLEERARIIESSAGKNETIIINVSAPVINRGIELD
ncbi:GLPGLI family protein [Flavobacterium sp.]|jgi:GLPGLI family protein|uniref:GLPGLI family protein n=1 Tax=Flavobacterium sp. TaxID=239 RepID=UPI00391B2821